MSDRAKLRADIAEAQGSYDLILTELKAAAVDVVAEAGDAAGVPVVLADNVPTAADGGVERIARRLAEIASARSGGSADA